MSILKGIKREWTYFKFLLPLLIKSRKLDKNQKLTVADLIEEQVDKNPDLIALQYDNQQFTYRELDQDDRSTRFRHLCTVPNSKF